MQGSDGGATFTGVVALSVVGLYIFYYVIMTAIRRGVREGMVLAQQDIREGRATQTGAAGAVPLPSAQARPTSPEPPST